MLLVQLLGVRHVSPGRGCQSGRGRCSSATPLPANVTTLPLVVSTRPGGVMFRSALLLAAFVLVPLILDAPAPPIHFVALQFGRCLRARGSILQLELEAAAVPELRDGAGAGAAAALARRCRGAKGWRRAARGHT